MYRTWSFNTHKTANEGLWLPVASLYDSTHNVAEYNMSKLMIKTQIYFYNTNLYMKFTAMSQFFNTGGSEVENQLKTGESKN